MCQSISNTCLYCKKTITGRQLALGCSVCFRWQHRKCNMGMDIVVYRVMVQGTIPWRCLDCRPAQKEPEELDQKELFLNYFSLGRSLCDLTKKDCIDHGTGLKEEGHFIDPIHESLDLLAFTTELIVEDNTSDIPWLMKIENVYSESLTQSDNHLKLQNSIIDEPSVALPWVPKIVSVHSEALPQDTASPDYSNLMDFDYTLNMPLIPCINSVYPENSSDQTRFPVILPNKIYKTSLPVENCPSCHTGLVPEQFTVNVVTTVMKTTCQCGLFIEINVRIPSSMTSTIKKKRKRNTTNTALKRIRLF